MFDTNDVKAKFNEIISNPSYKENMLKMQLQIRATGGRKLAADTVQNTYFAGYEHYIDERHSKIGASMSNVLLFSSYFFSLVFVGLFIWLSLEYIKK